jgi:hypothetical protein
MTRLSWLAAAMQFAGRIVSRALSAPPSKTPATRNRRPMLEVLEDRTAPSVNIVYGGGPTIPHVQVNNIVTGPQQVDTTALTQALVRDYLPLLTPYYGVGAGTLRSTINAAPFAGNPSNAQIQNLIVQELNSGAIPPPDGNQVYFVYLAPGQSVSGFQGTETTGYHANCYVFHDVSGYHLASLFPFGVQILPVYYAVSFGVGSVSMTASHELAEAVTDPAGTGYRDPSNSNGGEVADIYELAGSFALDGYAVNILSSPQGQMLSPTPPATPQNLLILAIEEAEALAFQYLANFYPQLSPYAQMAKATLNHNVLYGTPQGQIGVLIGEAAYYNWLSQLNRG